MKLYSVKVIADVLDLSEKRVRQLRDEGIIKEAQHRNYFDLVPTVRCYIQYLRNLNGSGNVDYNREKALLVKAKRESQELDLQVKERELHSTEVVEMVVSDMLIRFKSRIMAMPSKLAPKLAQLTKPEDVQEALRAAMCEALQELAEFGVALERWGDSEPEED